jgi:hypothetical protein
VGGSARWDMEKRRCHRKKKPLKLENVALRNRQSAEKRGSFGCGILCRFITRQVPIHLYQKNKQRLALSGTIRDYRGYRLSRRNSLNPRPRKMSRKIDELCAILTNVRRCSACSGKRQDILRSDSVCTSSILIDEILLSRRTASDQE